MIFTSESSTKKCAAITRDWSNDADGADNRFNTLRNHTQNKTGNLRKILWYREKLIPTWEKAKWKPVLKVLDCCSAFPKFQSLKDSSSQRQIFSNRPRSLPETYIAGVSCFLNTNFGKWGMTLIPSKLNQTSKYCKINMTNLTPKLFAKILGLH